MLLSRYNHLNKYFHIQNFKDYNEKDVLYLVRYFINYLTNKWQSNYYPSRDIAMDETMIPFCGQISFKLCLRNKPDINGMLMFTIADSDNGYILKGLN